MGDFFKPWRRKIGVVTLVFASLVTGGWVRSLTVREVISIPLQDSEEIFFSSNHNLSWLRHSVPPGGQRLLVSRKAVFPQWHVLALLINDYVDIKWRWSWGGFRRGEVLVRTVSAGTVWMIPYWFLVVPLTLLSAYLLLVKPRVAKPKTIVDSCRSE